LTDFFSNTNKIPAKPEEEGEEISLNVDFEEKNAQKDILDLLEDDEPPKMTKKVKTNNAAATKQVTLHNYF
jgi:hypothetical protein